MPRELSGQLLGKGRARENGRPPVDNNKRTNSGKQKQLIYADNVWSWESNN